MSTTLVTGGSGLVGFNIGAALRRRGRSVRYLARSPERMRSLLPEDAEIVRGDVTEAASVADAMRSLSDRYLSLAELAAEAARQLGLRRVPPVMPLWVGKLVAAVGESVSRLTGRPPLVPKGQLHFLQWGAIPRSDRARRELGWVPTPFPEGLARTLKASK